MPMSSYCATVTMENLEIQKDLMALGWINGITVNQSNKQPLDEKNAVLVSDEGADGWDDDEIKCI